MLTHFCGLLSCNFKGTLFQVHTRDLVLLLLLLLRLVMMMLLQLLLPLLGSGWWFQNKDNFLDPFPSSIVVVVVFVRRSRPRPRSKNQPGPCVVLRCCTHHTLQQLRRHTAMAAGFSEVHIRRPSPRASTATLFQCSRRGVFLFPRPMKIGTIFVSPQLRSLLASFGSFPNHTYRKNRPAPPRGPLPFLEKELLFSSLF